MALERIIPRTRADLEARMRQTPLEMFHVKRAERSLSLALSRSPGAGFILECKKASPSRGLIRPDFDIEALARAYAPYATAISVLTDEPFFQGDREYLRVVSSQTQVPVLCKDFIVDPYQVYEARAFGAHAALLMLSVLDDHEYRRCHAALEALGMEALSEVHDEHELERALSLGAKIIGINNRDLRTLKVDTQTTRRLAPLVPKDRLIVCESGIFERAQVRELSGLVDGFLVGTSMMQREDVAAAARELIFGRVKVCGLTRERDAQAALASGASFGGLIFAPSSPRAVSAEQALRLVQAAPGLGWVGVFVNHDIAQVARLAAELGLVAVQLHGDEDAAYLSALVARLPEHTQVWRAHRVRPDDRELQSLGEDKLLLDTYSEAQRGGTGRRFDWSLIPDARRGEVILSGGLDAACIAQADAQGVWALDVNSGVELEPGIKSETMMTQLFEALRAGRTPR